ncbi:MAG TPA: protein phosphatase 2C domain-containing protein [Thermoanaerobaculia bacterium]|jgi:serine/threonine protein phosphatase PrpC|nr:protein phosphatase 2C domain-containing protein [Thermoanaerobaculia bacterium]
MKKDTAKDTLDDTRAGARADRNGGRSGKGLRAAEGSDPGRERDNNEDRTLLDPDRGIYAVVDGVGGESGGEVAAQLAVDVLRARLSRRTTDTARLIREAIALANKQIYDRAQAEPGLQGMACVLTVAVLDDGEPDKPRQATIGHVGDSRLYLLRGGEIRKVTRDHSPVGIREDAGEISELAAMQHPRRNEIFRDVGSAPHEPDEDGFIEVHQIPFDAESALLLCSDGLSDLVTSAQILSRVEAHPGDPWSAVDDLIAAANEAGGKDNISVVLVEGERFAGGGGKQPAAPPAKTSTKTPDKGAPERSGVVPLRGAGRARPSVAERLWGALTSWPALLLYLVAAATLAVLLFPGPVRQLAAKAGLAGIFGADRPRVIKVSPNGSTGLRTIAEALEQAEAGQTVEVAPGDYLGPLELKDGVNLVSPTPRGAVVRLPKGVAEPAVSADGVHGVRFSGFRITGNAETPLAMGLRLADSAVDVEDVEISGASTAGLEIAGADRSALRFCFIHDNPGTGVIVRDQAVPHLVQNLILRNGLEKASPGPGIEIRDTARPQIVQNRLENNSAAAVWLPPDSAPERVDEIFGFNAFGNLPRDKAVRIAANPDEKAPATPTPPPAKKPRKPVKP